VITVGDNESQLERRGLPTEVAAFQLAAATLGPANMNAIGEVRISPSERQRDFPLGDCRVGEKEPGAAPGALLSDLCWTLADLTRRRA
jgi:hypothetical protein